MNHATRELQRLGGIVGGLFAIGISIFNCATRVMIDGSPLLDSIFTLNVGFLFLMGVITINSIALPSKITSIVQIAILLIMSAVLVASDYQSFFGMWFCTIAVCLCLKYNVAETRTGTFTLIGSIFLFYAINAFISASRSNSEDNSLIWAIKIVLFLMFDLALMWIMFEDVIMKLKRRNDEVEHVLKKNKPLVKVGENASSIVHSLKNTITRISVGLMFIESGINVQKGIDSIHRGLDESVERLQGVLELTRVSTDGSRDATPIKRFIDGFYTVFFEDIFIQNAISFRMVSTEGPENIVNVPKPTLILLLEHIFQNAVEAMNDFLPRAKVLDVLVTDDGFTIRNSGGCFPKCSECDNRSCLECPRFQEIGFTTKKSGSGNGISHVVRTCKEFGWGFSIRVNKEDNTTSFVFTTK